MPSDDGTLDDLNARISTHILDTIIGEPARDVYVRLERHDADGWSLMGEARTDDDGRAVFQTGLHEWRAGGYRLVFYVAPYLGSDGFFPEITVAFQAHDGQRELHVPLLLSKFGYTTYRGS